MTTKVIYFTIGGHDEQAEFSSEDSVENVREVFRVAAEADSNDILKLYNVRGSLVNISPGLAENSPDTRYRLEVVCSHVNGDMLSLPDRFNVEDLESRLDEIEKAISSLSEVVPDKLNDVKAKLESVRDKIEGYDHLGWLGLYKDLSQNASLHPFWNRHGHSLKSPEKYQHVWSKIEDFGDDPVPSEICEYLKMLSFDNWVWNDSEMIIFMRQMFIDLNLLTELKIEKPLLTRWLFAVYKSYNDVPFHNFKHCFMVTQMMYGLIWLLNLKSKLDNVDILILIVSAICHDLDHPGYNNAYQINAKTQLALLYNDISPLENHHCSVAFEILINKDVNILANLEVDVYKRLREGMIRCILATDMSKHNEILKNFRAVIHIFNWSSKEHRDLLLQILLKMSSMEVYVRPLDVAGPWIERKLAERFSQLSVILLKMADISNEVRPVDVAELWVECLLQEYFKQSDVEKLQGLPVAAFMDREKVSKQSSQIGFIKFILLPLVEAIEELFPVIKEDVLLPVQRSLEYYTQLQNNIGLDEKNSIHVSQNAEFLPDSLSVSLDHKFKILKMSKLPSSPPS